ncbi:MAG: hypothetical protein CM15mP117_22700 [Alphaproteobacteria bacterium]|nr:MAG: hypothetical protein CM15mP117_22700 [Alphaproteobacteria bacterium]
MSLIIVFKIFHYLSFFLAEALGLPRGLLEKTHENHNVIPGPCSANDGLFPGLGFLVAYNLMDNWLFP